MKLLQGAAPDLRTTRDYAEAAGVDDVADKGNLVRYMRTGASAPTEGRGAGPAAAVADALSAGLTLSKPRVPPELVSVVNSRELSRARTLANPWFLANALAYPPRIVRESSRIVRESLCIFPH